MHVQTRTTASLQGARAHTLLSALSSPGGGAAAGAPRSSRAETRRPGGRVREAEARFRLRSPGMAALARLTLVEREGYIPGKRLEMVGMER